MADHVSLTRRLLRPLLRPLLRRLLPRILPPTALGPADLFREVHVGLFGREADAGGAAAYTRALANGSLSVREMVRELGTARAAQHGQERELPVEEIVRSLYQGLLGRDPELAEMKIYTGALAAGLSIAAAAAELGATNESRRWFKSKALPPEELAELTATAEAVLSERLRSQGVKLALPSTGGQPDALTTLSSVRGALLALAATSDGQADAHAATSWA